MPSKHLRSSKKYNLFAVFFFLLAAHEASALDRQTVEVREALTGDTVELKSGTKLKFIGVESPPLQNITPLVRQYGAEARAYTHDLLAGKTVQVEWDSRIRDDQQRYIAYIFLSDGLFANKEVLSHGHGKFVMPPPNNKYASDLRNAELGARRDRLGLWREEPKNPFLKSEYIGEMNSKVYYFPTSPELDRIPAAQLVNFKSRIDAKAAGYRPCGNCYEDNKPGPY